MYENFLYENFLYEKFFYEIFLYENGVEMQKLNLMPMRFETWKIHRWIKTTANCNNLKLRF